MLNLGQIRERLEHGFHPFTLSLSDGRSYHIPHRDFIALGRNVVVVVDEQDISHTIDPLHIVSVDEPAQAGN